MPLMSHEVRWFFPGELKRFPELQGWIETAKPFPQEGTLPPPKAAGRLDGKPDVYLVVPGAVDMGVRWREGQLQIEGRVSRLGLQRFGRRFYGAVEVWAKWSYRGAGIESAFGSWFDKTAGGAPWETAAVRKTRILRKTRLDSRRRYVEVSEDSYPDRGLNVELTDLEVDGERYCSLAFEAFPNDAEMSESFTEAAEAWLASLSSAGVVLAEHQSMGYPEFLKGRTHMRVPAN